MPGFGLDLPTRAIARQPSGAIVWNLLNGILPGAMVLTRATEGTYVTASGNIATAPIDTARFTYDLVTGAARGLLVEPERTNIVTSADVQTPSWTISGSNASDLSTGALGLLNGANVASNGATWHRINNNLGTLDETLHTLTFYYRAGTSGACRIILRDAARALESRLEGPAGALTVSNQSAGTITDVAETLLQDGLTYRVQAQFTPSATNSYSIGLGPNTTTVGQNIIALGAQFELGGDATSLIQSTSGPQARSPDVVGIYGINGVYDVAVTYGDGTSETYSVQSLSDGYWPNITKTEIASLSLTPA